MKLTQGLYKDTDPIDQLQGTYPNARNVLINKIQGAVSNELGFDRITDLNKKIIGSIPIINDEIIIFSRDDDSTNQTITRNYAKYKVTIPRAMSGTLTIGFTDVDGIPGTTIVNITTLNAASSSATHVVYINNQNLVLQTDSSNHANNFTYTFSIASSTDSDNVASGLTVAKIANSDITINDEEYESEIGRLNKTGTYTPILKSKSLKFVSDSFMKGCFVLNYKKEVIIAFTDNKTPPKILNIDNLPFQVDSTTKKVLDERNIVLSYLFPEYKKPKIVYKEILDSGGALKSGAYFFAFAYEMEDGSVTNYTPLDGPFIVTNSTLELSGSFRKDMQNNFEIVSMYDGCEPDSPTSKSIKFTLTNIDTRYKYVHFSVYKKIGGVTTSEFIKKLEITTATTDENTDDSLEYVGVQTGSEEDDTFIVTYTGKETSSTLLLEDITVGNDTYSTAKSITYFESKLYLGNLTSHEDFNYQPYAMDIKSEWVRDFVDINSVKGSYKDELMVYNKRGFRPDEVYAFYISFLYNDGTWSGAYHIPGREKESVTIALQDSQDNYLTPITVNEDIKLSDIVLGDVDDGTITAADRVKYEEIFQHDLGISDDVRWFQTRDTARIDGKMGFWQNETEKYPDDEDSFGSNAGTPVRHHKFPAYNTMNGLNTTFVDTSADGSQPATGTGDLVVIAYMDKCEIDLRPDIPNEDDDTDISIWSQNDDNTGGSRSDHNQIFTRERVWHHLYLYVSSSTGQAAPGYYLLAKSRDPRDFVVNGKPYYHYLTDAEIEINGDMRSGSYQHSIIPPSQIVSGAVPITELYPNMLSPDNADALADGFDFEYEGAGMGKNLGTPIPNNPYRSAQEYYYVNGADINNYEGKIIGCYWWKWYRKFCLDAAHRSQAYARFWGEPKRIDACNRLHSSYDYTMKSDPIIENEESPQTAIINAFWNNSSYNKGSNNGNGIKTIRQGVEFKFTATLGNYLQPSFITSQPYGAIGNGTVKQSNTMSAIDSSTMAPVTFDSFHFHSGGLANQVAQAPLTSHNNFAATTTGNFSRGVWSNGNYTYTANIAHTLYLTGKHGIKVKTNRLSGAASGDLTVKHQVISGIRKVRRIDVSDTSTWIREDVYRNTEINTKTLKATNDNIVTSTMGGNFTSEDTEDVFRPDPHIAISLQAGDVLQFYHETVVTGPGTISHTASDYKTTVTYEYNLQVLTYNYTFPEPAYSPYSMNAAVLGVKFSNIKIPRQLKDKIQGYQIYYAERDNRNQQTFDQSIAFHGAPHALYPNQEGSYAGHLIPLGNLYLKDGVTPYGDSGIGYTGSDWTQTDNPTDTTTGGGMSLDIHSFSKQHRIIPTSLRFHGFDVLNNKPTIQSAYIKTVATLGSTDYSDVLTTARITAESGTGSASQYDGTVSFTADPDNEDALGVYRQVEGLNSTVDTPVQASYNQIWNRFATSTTVARNPSFSLATNHYKQIRQLQQPSYVPGDTVVNKKSITVNNVYGEECFHASIVHYDNEKTWSEINHHTGFINSAVSGGVTTYTHPQGFREIKSHYQKADGTDIIDQTKGPYYNLVDLKSFKTNVYNSFYDQNFIATNGYYELSTVDKLNLRYNDFIVKETAPIYGGDTYANMYGVRLTAPLYYSQGKQTPWYQSDNHFKAIKNIFFFPVYSTSNLGLRHAKTSITDSYYPRCGIGSMASTGETTTAGSMLDKKKQALHNWRARAVDITQTNSLNYNEDYNAVNNYNTVMTYDKRDNFLDAFPYRIIRSQSYGQEDKTMSLKEFKTNDYYEMPKNRGVMTNIEGVGKQLLIHHEHAIFKTTTKDVIATDSATATLGTGDIFNFAPTELITTENGYAGTQHLSSTLISKVGYSFVDVEQGKVFLVGNELNEISNKGMRKWFRDNLTFLNTSVQDNDTAFNIGGSGFTTAFDEENNRIILSKKDLKLKVTLYSNVQVPTSARPIDPYCLVGSDGNPTGQVGYANLEILDQYGEVITTVANVNSGDYASFYVAPALDLTVCPQKPAVYLNWEGNVWEGEKPKLTATLSEAQTVDFTITVAYSGTYNESPGIPSTTIVIPAGAISAFVEGGTIPTDQVIELSPTETIIATITAITKPGTNNQGNAITINNAGTDLGGAQTLIVLDCPVLVNDSVQGITNGGTSTFNILSNDSMGSTVSGINAVTTIKSLPKDSSNNIIGTLKDPNNSDAVLSVGSTLTGSTIKFTHAGGSSALTGSFEYTVTKGPCSSDATVSLQVLSVDVNTYIKIYFDDSGSMASTEDDLNAMKNAAYSNTHGLRRLLQDFYATGQTEAQGNTDNSTNGKNAYDSKVTIADYSSHGSAANERTFHVLNNGGNGFGTGGSDPFPNASKVIIFAFQDEASTVYHDGNFATNEKTSQYDTDIAALRSTLNGFSSNTTFYRANIFRVATSNTGEYSSFDDFITAVRAGSGSYSGTNGLSDKTTFVGYTDDVVPNNDNSVSSGYYKDLIKTAMEGLGYSF